MSGAQDSQPGYGGAQPGYGGTQPGYGGTQPGSGGTQPGSGGTQPGSGGTQPGYGGTQPGYGGTQPGYGGTQPGYGGTQPGYGGTQPGYGGTQPGYGGTQPGYGGTQPGYGGTQPGYAGAQPGYGGGGAATNMELEAVNWFRAVDTDNSGRITATELQQALTNSDWSRFSYEACTMIIKMFSRSPDGTLGINEFQAVLKYIKDWQAAFARYDNDRSGFIEQHELHQALSSMGYRLSPQCVSTMILRCDPKSGRQRVSLDDFIIISLKLQMLTERFKARDSQMRGEIDLRYDDFLAMVAEVL